MIEIGWWKELVLCELCGENMMRKAVGNEKAISFVHPEAYAERFVEFIEDIIEE